MEGNIEIIGRKVGMTQVFDETGKAITVTVVEVGPCPITQVKTELTDGYNAIQIAFDEQSLHRMTGALLKHFSKAGVNPCKVVREFRVGGKNVNEFAVGQSIVATHFETGELVDVIGVTKGLGFQGVVKAHDFSGGPKSHGSMLGRQGGSYGQRQWPGEVYKGKEMPTRSGGERKTTQNLEVVKVVAEKNLLLIKGSFAGANNSYVMVRKAKKSLIKKAQAK